MTAAELATKLEHFSLDHEAKTDVEPNRTLRIRFMNEAALLRQAAARLRAMEEALNYAQQLEECVAEFLDAYTAFNNDDLDEVSFNDAEHSMKIAMYASRKARAALAKEGE